jgi:L-glyceraldehyde 3-phosphate reductase
MNSTPIYKPAENRYDSMLYRRCGKSGLQLPALSLGLWHNFGGVDCLETGREILHHAFDHGITHFDLANNYGPPPGSAEESFGLIFDQDFRPFRDELIISTKAGYLMWPGPYGEWGSKKYLIASLDQSLKRMKLDYVDIFYSHRLDPDTPLEETMEALETAVRQGKALYVGVSNYPANETRRADQLLRERGLRCLIHQPKYSMFERWIEEELLDTLGNLGIGCIPFSPLAQGLLTSRYLKEIPQDSRAAKEHGFLKKEEIRPEVRNKILKLNEIATKRGQTLAQLALCWVLRDSRVTSALIGVSRLSQLQDNLDALNNRQISQSELQEIESILAA